jgi:hypothetical protein
MGDDVIEARLLHGCRSCDIRRAKANIANCTFRCEPPRMPDVGRHQVDADKTALWVSGALIRLLRRPAVASNWEQPD